ncbi:MAG: UDP-N-acetylglucosamine diphosphorylase [Eubacteriales bacterium]|nr:UDP-N-acetylglucosamine diphosphorylase [Eubacteriales bacterium]MDY3332906.1 UDP-N-acetylglucosamine diphosphorylase [Gallibacter sp.]
MTIKKNLQLNRKLESNGVLFVDIETAYISEESIIEEGVVIYPSVIIDGKSHVKKNSIVGMSTRIVDSTIGRGTEIWNSVILESKVGDNTKVGPFAYLRPKSNVGDNCKIGDFVEVKNSNFGDGSKASHLTYIGDADVGEDVNLGCGVVFVNYNGRDKNRTVVKDGAFVGCNSNLVSPVTVEENSYIAAGSTVVEDVPSGALHIARARGKNILGWVKKRGIIKVKEKSNDE